MSDYSYATIAANSVVTTDPGCLTIRCPDTKKQSY